MNRISGLYGITIDNDPQVNENVKAALVGGAKIIQFRNKQKSMSGLATAEILADLCHQYKATFIVNDDLELAMAVGADGVHLGRNDLDLKLARDKFGDKIIGVSCYNVLEYAIKAEQLGADYVAFGRFFPSFTKPSAAPADLSLLIKARKQLSIPIVAIGGVTTSNAASLIQAGAAAVAVIDNLFNRKNVQQQAQEFSTLFK